MRRSILLADDSPTIQRLVKQTFVDADIDIVAVSNGDAAIKKLPEIRPQLVLADVYMPGRNGYEVCAFVRNEPQLSGIPVVLLVGAFDAFDAETATQAGASAHITKPFEPQALVDLVNSLIGPDSQPAAAAVSSPEAPKPLELETPGASDHAAAPKTNGDATNGSAEPDDLLGLSDLFSSAPTAEGVFLSDDQMERIVDRVIKRLSTDVIQSVAWEVVPDIAERAVKDALKKQA